jgi:hypothetical protein
MAKQSARLPKRFPVGTTYVVEQGGSVKGMMLVRRYVLLPDGRRIDLAARLVPSPAAEQRTAPVRRGSRPARTRGMLEVST